MCHGRYHDMIHSYVPWLIHTYAMTRPHMCHDSSMCEWVAHSKCIQTWFFHVWQISFIYVAWLVHVCNTTHSYVWHDSFTCETWLLHMYDNTRSRVWQDVPAKSPFFCSHSWASFVLHMYDKTRSRVWQGSFIYVAWLVDICGMTRACMWLDSFITVTPLTHMWDMTRSYVWHDANICVWLDLFMQVKSHILTSQVTYYNYIYECICMSKYMNVYILYLYI